MVTRRECSRVGRWACRGRQVSRSSRWSPRGRWEGPVASGSSVAVDEFPAIRARQPAATDVVGLPGYRSCCSLAGLRPHYRAGAVRPAPALVLITFATKCDRVALGPGHRPPATRSRRSEGIKVVPVESLGRQLAHPCAGHDCHGSSRYKITVANGKDVRTRFGVRYVHGASSLFQLALLDRDSDAGHQVRSVDLDPRPAYGPAPTTRWARSWSPTAGTEVSLTGSQQVGLALDRPRPVRQTQPSRHRPGRDRCRRGVRRRRISGLRRPQLQRGRTPPDLGRLQMRQRRPSPLASSTIGGYMPGRTAPHHITMRNITISCDMHWPCQHADGGAWDHGVLHLLCRRRSARPAVREHHRRRQ